MKKQIYSLKSTARRLRHELDSLRNQSIEDDIEIVDQVNDVGL